MTQKTLDAFCQAKKFENRKIFFAKNIRKVLPQGPFPWYSLRVSNTSPNRMNAIYYSKEKDLFACYTNTDLTEGRGKQYLFALAENESTALRLAKGKDVQGTDATVRKVKAYFVPTDKNYMSIGCWYTPAGFIHTPSEVDLEAEKVLLENREKNLLLEKFKNGEEISAEEREKILLWLQK